MTCNANIPLCNLAYFVPVTSPLITPPKWIIGSRSGCTAERMAALDDT